MSRIYTLSTLFVTIFILVLFSSQLKADENIVTHTFMTSGNCSICLETIQGAGNSVAGVVSTVWDVDKDETTVTYDITVTDLHQVMTAIANTGYDTEWFPGSESAYQHLIGTCCEYVRVIDYSVTIVNYLSIMDLWLFPLDINEVIANEVGIFPNPTDGYCEVRLIPTEKSISLDVYNMAGSKVLSINAIENKILDLSILPCGQYICQFTNGGSVISKNKIIRN